MRSVYSLALLLGVFGGFAAFGQMNTGEISGSVQDASKGLLPGAMIVAQHLETGQKFTATANTSGEYLSPQLPVGVYSLTVSAVFDAKNFFDSAAAPMPKFARLTRVAIRATVRHDSRLSAQGLEAALRKGRPERDSIRLGRQGTCHPCPVERGRGS